MSPPPSPSQLVTPDRRRRLQQQYEEALRLARVPRPDSRRVHELLADCLRADAGNVLYLDALLANVRRHEEQQTSTWLKRLFRSVPAAPSLPTEPAKLLQQAPDLLWQQPHDAGLLLRLSSAASDSELDQAALRYAQLASELAPTNAEAARGLAQLVTRQGRFEEAVAAWKHVGVLLPQDREAQQALQDLNPLVPNNSMSAKDVTASIHGSSLDDLIQQSQTLQAAGHWTVAEELLCQAQAAHGGDLRLLGEREALRLRQSEARLSIARQRAVADPHAQAQSLVRRMEDEHRRLEIEMINLKVERQPADWTLRLELARRLKRGGNYSGAVQRLTEAQSLAPQEPSIEIELGECWQHLRQFEKALNYYQSAVSHAEQSKHQAADWQLARFRAAVLAAGLGQVETARAMFAAVLASDPSYKDARERLDNLTTSRHTSSSK